MKIIVLLVLIAHCSSYAAVNEAKIRSHINSAREAPSPSRTALMAASPPAPGAPDPIYEDRIRRLDQENQAIETLYETCDGRFNLLRFDLKRSITRSEKVSIAGGLLGVFGAIATCPHCAAIGAGLAGLANPMQQTFRDNADAPEHHRAKLTALSETINNEIAIYTALPAADAGDDDFEKKLRARLDALMKATSSCAYYDRAVLPSVSK